MVYTSIALFVISVCGAFLQTNIGFGFPVLAMIFLPQFFEFSTSVALCQTIAMASTTFLTLRYFSYIKWKTLLPLLITSLASGIIITLRSMNMQQRNLLIILGSALVGISLFTIYFSERIAIRPTIKNGAMMGIIAGTGNGFFGIGGPPVAIYFLASKLEKESYLATIQCYFWISNITTILLRANAGALSWSDAPYVISGWIGIAVGTLLGLRLFSRLKPSLLKKLVYAFVGISGVVIIIRQFY